jgi:GTP-binding protein
MAGRYTRRMPPASTSSSSLPVVAIVGRPNVGKSTLFNRLIGERLAIVEDEPGTTRDRVYGTAEWNGRLFTVVDTGGLELDPGSHIEARVQDQARVAMDEADVILFVVDAAVGLAPLDHEVADRLRRTSKPVILVINKADNPKREQEGAEFHAFGIEPNITVSAQHGRNTGDLADMIVWELPPPTEAEAAASVRADGDGVGELSEADLEELAETEMGPPRVAIVGRPNTGKSTFVNRVLGEERMIVSEVPGTTRDPVDTTVVVDDEPMVLVDTAGIRRRGSIDKGIERYSVLRSMKAIDRADVAVVMTDAIEGYTAQDAHVVGYVLDAGKGIVLVINKWDEVEKDGHTADEWLKVLRREAPYLAWADIVFGSALTGQRVERVLREARRVAEERYRRIPTGELNRVVTDAVRAHPPSHVRNRLPKVFYATQVAVAPPTFVVFVNDPELIHFSYRRYLENRIRDEYGFLGTPIRLILRARESEESARRSARPRRSRTSATRRKRS